MRRSLYVIAIFTSLLCIPLFFWGKLYLVGGDDTNLYYLFPKEYLQSVAFKFISDNSPGSLGTYFPNMHILTFNVAIVIARLIFKINTQLLFFGLNLACGFMFFFIFLTLFFNKSRDYQVMIVSSLLYTFSTFSIFTVWQGHLFAVYLVSLFPLILFLFIKALKTFNISYLIIFSITSSIFNIFFISLPWFFALLISILPILILLYFEHKKRFFLLGTISFILLMLLNFYWIFHLVYSPYSSDDIITNDMVSTLNSRDFLLSGENTIKSTSVRNELIYPFLGLFHKNIQKDFGWKSYISFSEWNLKLLNLNVIFFAPILLASLFLKRLAQKEKQLYLAAMSSWLVILFLFTVKIGEWGANLFIWLNNVIPGFVMFKNMYDKFGLAMAFSHAFLFALSMKIVLNVISSLHIRNYVLFFALGVILLNAKPFIFGDFYKHPIWTTKNTYGTITDFNSDFYDLLTYLKQMEEPSRFLWLPLNNANYIQISDKNLKNHYYSGVSPLRFLANISDFSGRLSFPPKLGGILFQKIEEKEYEAVGFYLQKLNVEYIIINHDIPKDLQQSYLFSKKLYSAQNNKAFYDVLLGDKVKDFGKKYSLYTINDVFSNEKVYLTKNINQFPIDFTKVKYEKKASYEYNVQVNNLANKSYLIFLDPYHKQWELRLSNNKKFANGSHIPIFDYANGWLLDPEYIKKNVSKNDYHINENGSININIKLYFKVQDYFIPAILVSAIALFGCIAFLIYKNSAYLKINKHA